MAIDRLNLRRYSSPYYMYVWACVLAYPEHKLEVKSINFIYALLPTFASTQKWMALNKGTKAKKSLRK